MDDGNGSFCVKVYKNRRIQVRMEIKANETVEQKLHTLGKGEEKIVAEHMKMNYNKVQYEKTIYVSRETYKSL